MLVDTSTNCKVSAQSRSMPLVPQGMGIVFSLVTTLFFLWGLPNNLNDVLIRQFMKSFELTRFEAGLIQSAFYLGYFLLATPAALIMRRYGYKSGMVIGLLLLGAGCFLFYPAAIVARYEFFLASLFVIACGLSFLETAANPFIAQMGAAETAARRLNFSQAFNPIGAIVGVLCGTLFIFSGVELAPAQVAAMQAAGTYQKYLQAETLRVVNPYLVIGAFAFLMAFALARTQFPKLTDFYAGKGSGEMSYRALLRYPHYLTAIVAQFLYVGAQVGTWSYFIQYVQETTHSPEKIAGYFLTGTLFAFGIGRFSSAQLMKRIAPSRLMAIYAVANVALVAVGVALPGWIGLWTIFLSSFFMSIMYPTIFALGIEGLGNNARLGSSLLIMAIIGGAILTPAMGLVAQHFGSIAFGYMVPLVCYVAVACYSLWGAHLAPIGAVKE